MDDDPLEWDDAKVAENWRRHGVTFQQGASNEPLAPSPSYLLFAQAIVERKQILCSYNG